MMDKVQKILPLIFQRQYLYSWYNYITCSVVHTVGSVSLNSYRFDTVSCVKDESNDLVIVCQHTWHLALVVLAKQRCLTPIVVQQCLHTLYTTVHHRYVHWGVTIGITHQTVDAVL